MVSERKFEVVASQTTLHARAQTAQLIDGCRQNASDTFSTYKRLLILRSLVGRLGAETLKNVLVIFVCMKSCTVFQLHRFPSIIVAY